MGRRKNKPKGKPVSFPGAHLYLSVEEAAKVVKVKPQTFRNWLVKKIIQPFKFKSLTLCLKKDVLAKKKEMDES